MARKEKKSIKGEYAKISVVGNKPYGRGAEPYVYITIADMSYGGGEAASQSFTVKEAKEIIGLLEQAIKKANKKEKN